MLIFQVEKSIVYLKLVLKGRGMECFEIHEAFQIFRTLWFPTLLFSKHYWHVASDNVCSLVGTVFEWVYFDPSLMETLIALIPKVDNSVRLDKLRPISICNVVHIISNKVLVNRFRSFLITLALHKVVSFLVEGQRIML